MTTKTETNLNVNDPDTIANFLAGVIGVPTATETLAWRLGNAVALREGGEAIVKLTERTYHADHDTYETWGRSLMSSTIAGGVPAGVNRDRWEERIAAGY